MSPELLQEYIIKAGLGIVVVLGFLWWVRSMFRDGE